MYGEYQLRRAEAQHVRNPRSANTSPVYLTHPQNRNMRKPDPVTNVVKRTSSGGFSHKTTNRRYINGGYGKSQTWLPVDDDKSDGAQADEEPLAGLKVRMCLVNIDTGTTRRRSAFSERRLKVIFFDRGRRDSST